MPLRILNLEGAALSRAARARLEELGSVDDDCPSQEQLADRIVPYHAVVMRFQFHLTADVIAHAARLRYVVCPTTGLDHIDTAALAGRDIKLISLQGQFDFLRSIHASAEHSWALLLALIRKLPAASRAPLAGKWVQAPYFGTELAGKRLGIVGLGRIGEKVARYGNAFSMIVSAYDPAPKGHTENVRMMPNLAALLTETDILSVHVPLNDDTRGLIGAREFSLLPNGAILVNTARGSIVDEAALLAALKEGHLRGAALDVLAGEGGHDFPSGHPLVEYARTNDNIVITPHIGGATRESRELTELHVVNRLAAAIQGKA